MNSSQARAYGDFAFDSSGAILFDKSDKALEFGDNYKASFGESGDLEIFHNGSFTQIRDTGPGNIAIDASGLIIHNAAGSETILYAHQNTGVSLYKNNVKRLQTADSGVNITGQITADSATIGIINTDQINVQSYTFTADSSQLTTLTQTAITSFSSSTYTGGKFLITAHDHVAGARQISELLVLRDSAAGTAHATEYGQIYTSGVLATYDVDINGGNIRILATSASINATTYQVAETLMRD